MKHIPWNRMADWREWFARRAPLAENRRQSRSDDDSSRQPQMTTQAPRAPSQPR